MSISKPAAPKQPSRAGQAGAKGADAERLAAALRDNLKRRKAQQRARDNPAKRREDGAAE
jgi:hypothetical protein